MNDDIQRLTEILENARLQSVDGHDRIDRYRRYYRDNIQDRTVPKKSGAEPVKSLYRSRAIKKLFKKKISLLTESVLADDFLFTSSGWNLGYTKEDRLLNYQWNILIDKQSVVTKSAKNLVVDGTAIVKTEWETESVEKIVDTEVPIMASSIGQVMETYPDRPEVVEAFKAGEPVPVGSTMKKVKTQKILSSKPTVKVIEPDNIYFANNGAIIERIRTSYIDIVSNASMEVKESVLKEAFSGSDTYNLSEMWVSNQEGNGYSSISTQTFFRSYRDLALKEIDIFQYWGKFEDDKDEVSMERDMVVVWTPSTVLSKIENPYHHKKPPYSIASYESFDGSKFGEAESEVLHHDQTAITTISRIFHSMVLNTNSGQKLYRDGLFTPQEERNYLNGVSAKFNKSYDVKDAILSADIPNLSNGSFDLMNMFGTSFNNGTQIDNSGNVIPAGIVDSALLRSYLSLLTSIAGFINSMNMQLNVNETTVVDALGSTVIPEGYLQNIDRDIRFIASAKTPHEKSEMSLSIEKLMATAGGNMDTAVSLSHYIELALINNNYSLARELSLTLESIKNPPEDPMQDIMIEREKLENERLKAETLRLKSQTEENIARAMERLNKIEEMTSRSEATLNDAKAILAKAQVEKSKAETDFFRNELDYVRSGRKARDEEIKAEFQHGANLEREKVRTDRELELNSKKSEEAKKDKKPDNPETFLQAYQKSRRLKNEHTNTVGNARTSVNNGKFADKEEEIQYGEPVRPN